MKYYTLQYRYKNGWASSYYNNFDLNTELFNIRKHWRQCGGKLDQYLFVGNKNILIEFQLTYSSDNITVSFKQVDVVSILK